MVSREDILNCYKFLLDREATAKEVDGWTASMKEKSVEELIRMFKSSREYLLLRTREVWGTDKYGMNKFDVLYKELFSNLSVSKILEIDNSLNFLRDVTLAKKDFGNYLRKYFDVLEVCARLSSLYDANRVLPIYSLKDTGVVIQGPIFTKDDFTEKIIVWYREIYPNIPIVVSTWKGKVDLKFKDICSRYNVTLLENDEPEYPGGWNVNYQLKSSLAGVQYLKSTTNIKYVLKSRTDQWFSRYDFLLYLKGLLDMYPVGGDGANSRIVTVITGDSPFYFSDQFAFGDITDIFNLYSAPYENEEFLYTQKFFGRFLKLNWIFRMIKSNLSSNEFKGINNMRSEWRKHGKFVHKFLFPEAYIMSCYYNKFIKHIEPDRYIYHWLNFLKNYVVIPEKLFIYWPKYERYRLSFWGNDSDSRQWQKFCKAYEPLECKVICRQYWSGKISIQDVLRYADQCKDVDEVEYLAEIILHEKGKLSVNNHQYIDEKLEKMSSILPKKSFVVSLLQLEKNGKVTIQKELLHKKKNFVLLLEILERKKILAENESAIRSLCAGDYMRTMILEAFLRIAKDERVKFFAMKDEEELWIRYVPFLTDEQKKRFSVKKNECGKTWPWVDEDNDSAFAAYMKLVNDGVYFSIEFCAENTDDVRGMFELTSLCEDSFTDEQAAIRLKESTIQFSNVIKINEAVNRFIDEFCDVGEKILRGY